MEKTAPQIVEASLQDFGNLIITDYTLNIIALSENVTAFTPFNPQQLLGTPLEDFLKSLWEGDCDKFLKTVQSVLTKEIPSQVFSKKIKNNYYYFKINHSKGFVYIDWEEQRRKHISVSRMNELGFLFDEIYTNNWQFLSKALQKLLKYERVFIVQVQDTGQSKVIAEQLKTEKESYLGKEFSDTFLPEEVLGYYKSLSYRYVPNFKKTYQKLYGIDTAINILCSALAPPPGHLATYLQSHGVQSMLTFPLYLEGQFWGLVVAQHIKSKKIDLQQRKLCTFIIQSAMSKFENLIKQGLIDQNQQLLETESVLKLSLANNKTINCAMVEHMGLLMEMVKADGLAIYNQGDTFFNGTVPDTELFYELIEYLKTATSKKIFKDYNFRLNHGSHFSKKLPFAGLLSYTLGNDKDYYIVWFRKEQPSSVVQLDIVTDYQGEFIRTWEESIHDAAIPWDEDDIKFVQMLQQTIKESIVSKATEKELLNEELRTLNNELEMFTFSLSHDLKNPLSVLKMGLQFLQATGDSLAHAKRIEWYKNLSGSVSNIEDIINNIVTVSQSKIAATAKTPIPMSYTIRKILQDAILLNEAPQCDIKLGQLLPIWGEKSSLYQIFLNIINNAVKYSCMSTPQKIRIDSMMDDKKVCYIVKDNGIGIPSENLPHIFDIFTRASNAKSYEGTGVGLSLVKRIMDRQGGKIEVESTEGSGTTIKLYFPITSPFPSSML